MQEEGINWKVKCCAKISISMPKYRNTPEAVVYWNSGFTVDQIADKMWYFEYLASLLKVHYPKRKVVLVTGRQDMPVGQEYIETRSKTLLSAKRGQLKKLLNSPYDDDLFGFNREKRQNKIAKIEEEIKALESGQFNYWVAPTYINRIKEYIKKSDRYAIWNKLR